MRTEHSLIPQYLLLSAEPERETGFDPATFALEGRHSTTELLPRVANHKSKIQNLKFRVGARGFEHLIYYDGLIIAHFLGYLSHNCISVSDSIGASTLLKSVFVV